MIGPPIVEPLAISPVGLGHAEQDAVAIIPPVHGVGLHRRRFLDQRYALAGHAKRALGHLDRFGAGQRMGEHEQDEIALLDRPRRRAHRPGVDRRRHHENGLLHRPARQKPEWHNDRRRLPEPVGARGLAEPRTAERNGCAPRQSLQTDRQMLTGLPGETEHRAPPLFRRGGQFLRANRKGRHRRKRYGSRADFPPRARNRGAPDRPGSWRARARG